MNLRWPTDFSSDVQASHIRMKCEGNREGRTKRKVAGGPCSLSALDGAFSVSIILQTCRCFFACSISVIRGICGSLLQQTVRLSFATSRLTRTIVAMAVYNEDLTMYVVLLPQVGCFHDATCSSVLVQLQHRLNNLDIHSPRRGKWPMRRLLDDICSLRPGSISACMWHKLMPVTDTRGGRMMRGHAVLCGGLSMF